MRVEMRCAIKDKVRSKESRWEGREEGTGKRRSLAAKLDRIGPHVCRLVAYGPGNFMHSDLHHAAASEQSNFPAHFPDWSKNLLPTLDAALGVDVMKRIQG